MDLTSIKKSYRFYAPVYDIVFGRIVAQGRRQAVTRLPDAAGSRILEIGVGTGLSLPLYSPLVSVTGIDVSEEMLERARRQYQNDKHPHVTALLQMDAQALEFPDNSFDGIAAMYVASVVPDPFAMAREMIRVAKPGARLVVVNHFTSRSKVLRFMETKLNPLSNRLGFRPDFAMDVFVNMLGLQPTDVASVNLGGYWKLLEFVVEKPSGPINGHAVAGELHSGNGTNPG